MDGLGKLPLALGAAALLAACASSQLLKDDREKACNVVVEEKFEQPLARPNAISGSTGPVVGAAEGLAHVAGSGGVGSGGIVIVPLVVLIGAGYGAACAAAASRQPAAHADFERLLQESDWHVMKREIESRIASPRPECASRPADTPHDAVLEIRKVEATMACLIGRQQFSIQVDWRTVTAKDAKVLNETMTFRQHRSPLQVDEWFARPGQARGEMERVMRDIGREIASQFVDD